MKVAKMIKKVLNLSVNCKYDYFRLVDIAKMIIFA